MTSLRPDELTSQERITRNENFDKNVKRGTTAAIGLAGLSSSILPFLNENIPSQLAMKAINKFSPKLGSFLKNGMEQGLNIKEGFKFLKEKFSPEEQAEENPKEKLEGMKKKKLAKESGGLPEGFFKEALSFFKKGKKPSREANPFLQFAKQYYDDGIIKTEDDLKDLYDEYILKKSGQQKKAPLTQGLQEQFQQGYPQQQSKQPGQGQTALLQAIQELKSLRGG